MLAGVEAAGTIVSCGLRFYEPKTETENVGATYLSPDKKNSKKIQGKKRNRSQR
jgi:hypothetical protein